MSYYFPFGAGAATTNISYSLSVVTASVPFSTSTIALTTLFSPTVKNTPANGTNGTNATTEYCQANPPQLISGSTGLQGETGSKGSDNNICPENSIRCNALEVSLSAGYNDGVTRGVNYYVPSGSQYSIVCMQVAPGCFAGSAPTASCPEYLPMGTWPSIP